MRVQPPHRWPASAEEAVEIQLRLRESVCLRPASPPEVRTVAGVDVCYDPRPDRVIGVVSVLAATTLAPVEETWAAQQVSFPYQSGLFAFRELPPLLAALEKLARPPDLVICDGHGLAHPRRFGLACHLGVITDLPCIGVAKHAMQPWSPPGQARGERSDLTQDGQQLGEVLRTRDGVKPVFVSVGHRITLDQACEVVLACTPRFRIPEPLRAADHRGRELLRAQRDEA